MIWLFHRYLSGSNQCLCWTKNFGLWLFDWLRLAKKDLGENFVSTFKTNDDVGWTLFSGRQKEWLEQWHSLTRLDGIKVSINKNGKGKLPDQINDSGSCRKLKHSNGANYPQRRPPTLSRFIFTRLLIDQNWTQNALPTRKAKSFPILTHFIFTKFS